MLLSRGLIALLAILSLTWGCRDRDVTAAAREGAAPPRQVKVIKVQPAPITRSIALTGTIAADEQVVLALKVTGRIADITVDLGSPVRRGQVLARLTPT